MKEKLEKLQMAIETFTFLDERFMRKYASNGLIEGLTKDSVKAEVKLRMTELFVLISSITDEITDEVKEKVAILLSEPIKTREDNIKEAKKEHEKALSEERVEPETKSEKEKKAVPPPDEEEQETGTSTEPETSEETEKLPDGATKAQNSNLPEIKEDPKLEDQKGEEDDDGREIIPESRRIVFDEELMKILDEGNKRKGGVKDSTNKCLQMIGSFYEGSTEVQLSKETSTHKHRHAYIQGLRKIMKERHQEWKATWRQFKSELRAERQNKGDVLTPAIEMEIENTAKAKALEILAKKRADLLEEAKNMEKEGQLKDVDGRNISVPEALTAELPEDINKVGETLVKGDGLEGVIPNGTEKTIKDIIEEPEASTEPEITDEDEKAVPSAEDVAELASEETSTSEDTPANEESETSTEESETDENTETTEEDLPAANEVEVDDKTKVVTPEEIQAANAAEEVSTDAEPEASTDDEIPDPPGTEEEPDETEPSTLTEMVEIELIGTAQELVDEIERMLVKTDNRYDLSKEDKDDAKMAVAMFYKTDPWAQKEHSVYKWIEKVVANYNKKARAGSSGSTKNFTLQCGTAALLGGHFWRRPSPSLGGRDGGSDKPANLIKAF